MMCLDDVHTNYRNEIFVNHTPVPNDNPAGGWIKIRSNAKKQKIDWEGLNLLFFFLYFSVNGLDHRIWSVGVMDGHLSIGIFLVL